MPPRVLGWTFFAFFLVSGFASLTYEIVCLRLAMAHFGVTAAMIAIVLSLFMGGLAAGSWLAGRVVEGVGGALRTATLIRWYAVTEAAMAVFGLLVPSGLALGRGLLLESGAPSWGSASYHALSAAWVAVVLAPLSTCMGATIPLGMAALRPHAGAGAPRVFSHLYLANLLGATLGTLTSALVLVELFGFGGTLRIAAGLNGALAAGAMLLSFVLSPTVASASIPSPPPAIPARPAARAEEPPSAWLRLCLFSTGLVSMASEVVWVRLLTPYLGTVVYAFAFILSVYLAAGFVGAFLYRRLAPAGRGSARLALAAAGPLALLPLVMADPRVFAAAQGVGSRLGSVLSIVPFCLVVGFLTPMLVDAWSRGGPRVAGRAYALNVLGCIAGPLLAGFVLMPLVGERWALALLALPLIGLSLWPSPDAAPAARLRPALAATAAGAAVLVLTGPFEARFAPAEVRRDSAATVVAYGSGMERRLLVNGIAMTHLTPITKMMAHLPLGLLPYEPRHGLVLCFGMGTSARSMHSWGIETTTVELVPSVPELFSFFFDDTRELARSPRFRIVVDDGRRYLERVSDSYDVIVIDPPPPLEAAGSSLLYSREFYRVARRRLAPGGILQQWIPVNSGVDPALVGSLVRSLRDVFPHVRGYRSIEGWGLHLLASDRRLPSPAPYEVAARMPEAAVRDLVEWGPRANPARQFAGVLHREVPLETVGGRRSLAALQDDRPHNEYYLLRWLRTRWRPHPW